MNGLRRHMGMSSLEVVATLFSIALADLGAPPHTRCFQPGVSPSSTRTGSSLGSDADPRARARHQKRDCEKDEIYKLPLRVAVRSSGLLPDRA